MTRESQIDSAASFDASLIAPAHQPTSPRYVIATRMMTRFLAWSGGQIVNPASGLPNLAHVISDAHALMTIDANDMH